ncbi:polyhydroxyalkanoate depolymerase [Herbaspirillum huttiense]|jgi:poly(3-hydroxybutyrate) depolymerase|uniref:Polyhydroxyalkanoate depolymerase n=2 Tax=Herbaspirillum huttiense TaxID=863372 RepID=A0AAJ2HBX6_9BURK|nr:MULTISPECIES: polyhydroxyalkanoate depolymerase [Herbaspirillum]MAF06118.1 polyhydroxyalkanoate depolymerase [Herbaspirillum sp.]MBN9358044.1 polyhydroxyalkanoate depolymerase [Herbaspirillum huttiense]MBO17840.1 polyhydroxyalkanoate depolymerase [Herbaspirillum sp.]MCP3656938.1 polyhydroxyalkanoate depolymerase [Herbaspirillum sp.]MCP3946235.1 polyhydroxyalkanoate depolymerase [Herbaspirillum sp.]|tara:strand:+ start:3370 stop:4605 length:1236 start_codon:yes stop_codon:yes gene_type:complete
MLYQLHELNRAFLNPMMQWAETSAKLFSDPVSPLAHTPFSQRIAAGYELLYRLSKEYEKPLFNIGEVPVDGKPVGITEEVVEEKPFCRLIHFKKDLSARQSAALKQPTVLVVAPLSGHHSTLLRETVRALLQEHDVFITDWTDARMVPVEAGEFHLHDYVYYVQDFIRTLGPDVHVISVCQPTVPVLAAISLMASANDPKLPKSMTMMGGPIDARKSPTAVNDLATEKPFSWFENTVIYSVPANYPGFGRKVYPGFLQHAGFVAMNPRRHAQSHWDFYMHLRDGDDASAEEHRKFYDEYNAVLDMPAEFYLETIKVVFQDFNLARGTWEIEGKLVRPQDIKSVALFTIEGELDDISGSGQTQAAQELCSSIPKARKQHFTVPKAGHYGIFSGRRWREIVCPKIGEFIRANA